MERGLLHTEAFTQGSPYTEHLSHKVAFHTDAFTHRSFYILRRITWKSQFYLTQFLAIEPHFVRKGCTGQVKIAIFGDRTSFPAKGLRREPGNRNFTAVFGDRTLFRAKGLRGAT